MSKNLKITWTLCTLMVAASAASKLLTPTIVIADQGPRINLETMVPKQFGEWSVDPHAMASVAPSAEVQANLDRTYDQILSRTYVSASGQAIMLTVTYGSRQTQELRAHRQEVCYSAQGFEIANLNTAQLKIADRTVEATRMFATKGARSEPVTYWFTMGDKVVHSRTERMLVQLKYSFSGIIPDGMLVRVSSLTEDEQGGYRNQEAFLQALSGALSPDAVSKLLGSGFTPKSYWNN